MAAAHAAAIVLWRYDEPYARYNLSADDVTTVLDLGVGIRPDATGRGSGTAFIRSALAFGAASYRQRRFGATIAAFNGRALRAAERAGFRITRRFTALDTEWVQVQTDLDDMPR